MKLGWHTLALLLVLGGGCGLFDFSEPTPPETSDGGASNLPAGGKSGPTNGGQTSTPDAGAAQSDGGMVEPGTSGSGGSGGTGGHATTGGAAGTASGTAGRAGAGGSLGSGGSNAVGGFAGASGEPGFEDCGVAAPFPSLTTPLDVFNRQGPELGDSWDASGLGVIGATAKLSPGFVTIEPRGSIANIVEWKTPFGNAQEVWAQISNFTPEVVAVALWMRSGLVTILYQADQRFLAIEYDPENHYDLVIQKNVTLPTTRPVVLGGRAFPNGCVQLFVDGQLKLHGYLQNGNPKPDDSYHTGDGRIGFAAEGPAHFERFGGGTLAP